MITNKSFLYFLILLLIPISSYCDDIKKWELIADSLYANGIEEYKNKQFEKACGYFKQVSIINDSIERKEPFFSSNSEHWEAASLYNLGDTLSAYELSNEYMLIPVDQRKTVISDSLWSVSEEAFEHENYDLAISLAKKAIEKEEAVLGDNHYYVANSYVSLSTMYIEIDLIKEAKDLLLKAINIFEQLGYPITDNCVEAFSLRSELSYQMQEYKESICILKKILEVIKNNKLSRGTRLQGVILHNLSRSYCNNKNYYSAIKSGEESITYLGNDSTDNELKGGLYSVLGNCYAMEGDYKRAMECEFASYKLFKIAQIHDERIISTLSDAVFLGYRAEAYDSALIYNQMIFDYYSTSTDNDFPSKYLDKAIVVLPILYFEQNKITEASSLLPKAIKIFKSNVYDTGEYVFWGLKLSNVCYACSDYIRCLDVLDFLYRQYENRALTFWEQYGIVLEEMANLYNGLGDYNKAIYYGENALDYIDKYRDERERAMIRHNLSFFYHKSGNFQKAYSLSLEALSFIRKFKDANWLRSHLLDLSEMLYDEGKYRQTIKYATKASKICETKDFDRALQNISAGYWGIGNYKKSFKYLQKALKVSPGSKYLNNNMACSCFMLKNFTDTGRFNAIALNAFRDDVIESLKQIPIRQWPLFWEKTRKYIKNTIHYVNESNNMVPLINETAYDAMILSKGFLLNNNRNIKRIIEKSNSDVNKTWNEYIANKQAMENGNMNNKVFVDSIENIISAYILENCNKANIPSWETVRQCLSSNDVAIEFFVDYVYADPVYGALILKKDYSHPMYVRICTEKQLLSYVDSISYKIYNNIDFGTLLWGKIINKAKLKMNNNIYFSADGLLNTIAIENVILNENYSIGDYYKIHRVSSTSVVQDVDYKDSMLFNRPIILFGGLDYNSKKYIELDVQSNELYSQDEKEEQIRSKLGFLPYSKLEVDSIEQIADNFDMDVVKNTGGEGTETSFRNSLLINPAIIHLSTHGYYNISQENHLHSFKYLLPERKDNNNDISLSLRKTGLLFSYSFNNINKSVLYSNDAPYNVDDNVLTGLELCDLNLASLDLVVLSACQTALGDITPDGIAGLQRGLKYAGAGTIIMSLWKVDDMATSMLMIEFYKELFKTGSKSKAYRHAQHLVKIKYDDPYYWAGFILLD